MKAAALELVEQYGFYIFPLTHPDEGGESAGKRPAIKNWPEMATNDPAQIETWWDQRPDANIGIMTGEKSKVFVIDVDEGPTKDGFRSLSDLQKSMPDWNPTLTATSGSGGIHFYFCYPTAGLVRNSTSLLAPGIDVRGEGGYIVAPPSLHACGHRYQWQNS